MEKEKFTEKNFLKLYLIFLAIVFTIFGIVYYSSTTVVVNWSRNKETEWTYKEAMNILKKSGFSEISTEPYNILTKKIGTENDLKVADISIDSKLNFNSNDRFSETAPVVIKYYNFSDDTIKLKINSDGNLPSTNVVEDKYSQIKYYEKMGFQNVNIIENKKLTDKDSNDYGLIEDVLLTNNKDSYKLYSVRNPSPDYKNKKNYDCLYINKDVPIYLKINTPKDGYASLNKELLYKNINITKEKLKENGFINVEYIAIENPDFNNDEIVEINYLTKDKHKKILSENVIISNDSSISVIYCDNNKAEKKPSTQENSTKQDDNTSELTTSITPYNDYIKNVKTMSELINTSSGIAIIDSVEGTGVAPFINVNLNSSITQYSNLQIQSFINNLNESLVSIGRTNGYDFPAFYYYVDGIKVATNRYIVDPNEVNFEDIFE